MPLLDGFEATKEIRKTFKNIPIIAQSANVSPEDVLLAYDAGMDDYVKKPITKNELLDVLNKYLNTDSDSSTKKEQQSAIL